MTEESGPGMKVLLMDKQTVSKKSKGYADLITLPSLAK